MRFLNRIKIAFLSLSILTTMAACTEELDYTPAEKLTNAQVYFPLTNASKVSLSKNENTFSIDIKRANTDNAITVNLNVTDESNLFNIPTSVAFTAGESVAQIQIGYNPDDFTYDDFKDIKISIADADFTTPYGTSEFAFQAGVPSPYISLGKATFIDAFNMENTEGYKVEIQQNQEQPNTFRLVKPYDEAIEEEEWPTKGDQTDYLTFRVLTPGETLGEVTITQPDLVYFNTASTGYYVNNYSATINIYHPSSFTSMQDESLFGYSKVLSYQANGLPAVVQLAPYYYMAGVGGWNNTQTDGIMTIVFPGVVLKDFSVDVEYVGAFVSPDDESFAIANVTLGDDVESAKIALIEGEDIDSAISGILDGTLETISVSESGEVRIPNTCNGTCSIIVISYGDNEAQELAYTTFEYTVGKSVTTEHSGKQSIKRMGLKRDLHVIQ